MEDFVSFLALIVCLLGLIPSSKKKAKRKKASQSKQTLDEFLRKAAEFAEMAASEKERAGKAEEKRPQEKPRDQAQKAAEKAEDPFAQRQLHVHGGSTMLHHAPSSAEFAAAGEGFDPCHIGGALDGDALASYDMPVVDDEQREGLRRKLLDGVIMSEVLARPSVRRRR